MGRRQSVGAENEAWVFSRPGPAWPGPIRHDPRVAPLGGAARGKCGGRRSAVATGALRDRDEGTRIGAQTEQA